MRLIALPLLSILALAACQSRIPECRGGAAKELVTLDTLIAESQENLRRGYAMGSPNAGGGSAVQLCMGSGSSNVGMSFCSGGGLGAGREAPVAIDLQAERSKLQSMLHKRSDLAQRAQLETAACAAARS